MTESETQEETVTVYEDKFQATGIYTVTAPSKDEAKIHAEIFFKEEYGHSPSRVIAEETESLSLNSDKREWEIVVSDQSSGSLKGSKTYTLK